MERAIYALLHEIEKGARRRNTYARLQREAASREGSVLVHTGNGPVGMSPIEHALHEAMRREGLAPVLQLCVQGYTVDFAFPDVLLAVGPRGSRHARGAD